MLDEVSSEASWAWATAHSDDAPPAIPHGHTPEPEVRVTEARIEQLLAGLPENTHRMDLVPELLSGVTALRALLSGELLGRIGLGRVDQAHALEARAAALARFATLWGASAHAARRALSPLDTALLARLANEQLRDLAADVEAAAHAAAGPALLAGTSACSSGGEARSLLPSATDLAQHESLRAQEAAAAAPFGVDVASTREQLTREAALRFLLRKASMRLADVSVQLPEVSGDGPDADVAFVPGTFAQTAVTARVWRAPVLRAQTPAALALLACELESWRRLRHPNVQAFLGCSPLPDAGGLLCLAERLPLTLQDVLRGRPSPDASGPAAQQQQQQQQLLLLLATAVASAVALALDCLHERGAAHGRVCPANVLMSDADGAAAHIKLAGFPLARAPGLEPPLPLQFAAPELAERPPRQTAAADVYALGQLLRAVLGARAESGGTAAGAAQDVPGKQAGGAGKAAVAAAAVAAAAVAAAAGRGGGGEGGGGWLLAAASDCCAAAAGARPAALEVFQGAATRQWPLAAASSFPPAVAVRVAREAPERAGKPLPADAQQVEAARRRRRRRRVLLALMLLALLLVAAAVALALLLSGGGDDGAGGGVERCEFGPGFSGEELCELAGQTWQCDASSGCALALVFAGRPLQFRLLVPDSGPAAIGGGVRPDPAFPQCAGAVLDAVPAAARTGPGAVAELARALQSLSLDADACPLARGSLQLQSGGAALGAAPDGNGALVALPSDAPRNATTLRAALADRFAPFELLLSASGAPLQAPSAGPVAFAAAGAARRALQGPAGGAAALFELDGASLADARVSVVGPDGAPAGLRLCVRGGVAEVLGETAASDGACDGAFGVAAADGARGEAAFLPQVQSFAATGQPTTAVTAQPTTAQPTTAQPTTAQPTTAQPTMAQPTTAQPTTSPPTTAPPTTAQPTSSQPSPNPTPNPTSVRSCFRLRANGLCRDDNDGGGVFLRVCGTSDTAPCSLTDCFLECLARNDVCTGVEHLLTSGDLGRCEVHFGSINTAFSLLQAGSNRACFALFNRCKV